MSKVWGFMIIFSLIISMITGNIGIILESIMNSSKNSIENIITLTGMMCFWSGIFKILENTSIIDRFSKLIKKTIYFLFDKENLNQKSLEYMSLNIASNVIGIGNASTINGIKAMQSLQEENSLKDIPNDNMTTFVLLNTASLQLLPTNIIALRSMYGSVDPTSVTVPIWIVTSCSLLVGIISIKLLNKRI